jgi:hypothetical protein
MSSINLTPLKSIPEVIIDESKPTAASFGAMLFGSGFKMR